MEELLKVLASYTALGLDAAAVAIVTYGAMDAIVQASRTKPGRRALTGRRKVAFVQLGAWLVLGLEFELAADIVHTVIAPTWSQLGKLAAIAVIRTFLTYFLDRDIDAMTERNAERRDYAAGA